MQGIDALQHALKAAAVVESRELEQLCSDEYPALRPHRPCVGVGALSQDQRQGQEVVEGDRLVVLLLDQAGDPFRLCASNALQLVHPQVVEEERVAGGQA